MPDHLGNFLGIYNPITSEQVKALTEMSHPRSGSGYAVPYSSSWATPSTFDFRQLAGDLSQSSLVMSGVRWLGNVLPGAPLMVMEAKGEQDAPKEVKGHLLSKLWRRPNGVYSCSRMLKGIAYSWILDGNAYLIKVWNDAKTKPAELWWEPHTSIRPRWIGDSQINSGPYIWNERDDPRDFINYYELDRDGRHYRLEVSDVIHFADGFDPRNDRVGLSRIKAVLREIYGDTEAANFAARLAGGSGVPPFVMSLDKELEIDQPGITGLENELVRKTSGDKKGRPLVIVGGTVHKLGTDPDKMDLRASHRFYEERYAATTGIPALALELGAGHEQSTYNNVKQADERAYEAYLLPLYGHFEDELNVRLLEDFEGKDTERFCKFDLSNIRALEEDKDALHKRAALDYRTGAIDRYEYRQRIGEEARDEDKNVYFPNTGAKADEEESETTAEDERILRLVKSVKAVPPDDEVEKSVEWWRESVPQAAGLIDARISENGNGSKR